MIRFNVKNILLLSLFFFVLLYFRRADQLMHPDVWTEDGAFNIMSFVHHGWHNLLEPVQGYLITISKLITNISMSISFSYYPEISTAMAWIFTIIVSLVIVYAPTILPYRITAATMIYMVPAYGEAYGLPLFSFWFAGLFVLLAMLWKPSEKLWLKNTLILIGGLSSPVIIASLPAQLFRVLFFEKRKEELFTFGIMIVISLIQMNAMLHTGTVTHETGESLSHLLDTIDMRSYIIFFFGKYYLGSLLMEDYSRWIALDYTLLLFGGIFLLLLIGIYFIVKRKDPYVYLLLYLLFSMIVIVLYRVGFEVARLSPRYFFYISILLSWLLLYMMHNIRSYRFVVIPILLLSVTTSLGIFCKKSQSLEWRKHIHLCAKSKDVYYSIPIHFAGLKSDTWHISMETKTCQYFFKNDFFGTGE